MSYPQELDDLLRRNRDIREAMPNAWGAFFASFPSLRPVQLEAMPAILSGRDVLVMAPTAGGKTEAVVAPVAEMLRRDQWGGLSTLIVTPTRALVNDLFNRLDRPLGAMSVSVARKTGDHQLGSGQPPNVLITTPESLESLLILRRATLVDLRAVILDEIHLLDGSPRGDQLRCLLGRLRRFLEFTRGEAGTPTGIQVVALSATVSDPARIASVYLGNDPVLVQVPGQRSIRSHIVLVEGDDDALRAQTAIDAMDAFPDAKKVLCFVNSRRLVDTGTKHFKHGRFANASVYAHHGSLSKGEREKAEAGFKQDGRSICVATTTLEVGIDIGDVDLVCCIDPPFSLSGFLQRIGRGSRRSAGQTNVLCVARDRCGELIFHALVRQSGETLPRVQRPPFRRSVLVQQVLAYLKQSPGQQRVAEQFHRVFSSDGDPRISTEAVNHVLQDLVAEGLLHEQHGVFEPGSKGREFIESVKIYSNIQASPLECQVVDVETGRTVGSVSGVKAGSTGVQVAGRSYDLVPGGGPRQIRVRLGGDHQGSPTYSARASPYGEDVGASLAGHFGVAAHELLRLRVSGVDHWMTWLGKLSNSVLTAGLRRQGFHAASGPFHVAINGEAPADPLEALREAARAVSQANPLGGPDLKIDRMVDLGPHHDLLSPAMRTATERDWLDAEYLQAWAEGISTVREVQMGTDLSNDLQALVG